MKHNGCWSCGGGEDEILQSITIRDKDNKLVSVALCSVCIKNY